MSVISRSTLLSSLSQSFLRSRKLRWLDRTLMGFETGSVAGVEGCVLGVWSFAFGVGAWVEDFVFGDAEAAEFDAEFRRFEALGCDGVGQGGIR
jgi:hypothetical protein